MRNSLSAARRRKGKPKKPLGRKAALEAMDTRLGVANMKRQTERAASLGALNVEADSDTVERKYVSPSLEVKRWFD